jgi:hypothetical protein
MGAPDRLRIWGELLLRSCFNLVCTFCRCKSLAATRTAGGREGQLALVPGSASAHGGIAATVHDVWLGVSELTAPRLADLFET